MRNLRSISYVGAQGNDHPIVVAYPQAMQCCDLVNKHSVRAELGNTFEISQPSNPTTGYKWIPLFDQMHLELKAETFEGPSSGLGRGGRQQFTFFAKQRGKAEIRFVYKRPWENSFLKQDYYEIIID